MTNLTKGPRFVDHTNKKYGNWVVLRYSHGSHRKCRCVCGKIKNPQISSLINGSSRSCGCSFGFTHGMTNTSEFVIWCGIKKRCYNPKNKAFPRYGGVGIKMSKRWFHSFEAFFKDMGPRPKGKSIDRKDGTKGYNVSNCRWASRITQQNNTTRNRRIAFGDKNLTVTQWSRKTGLRPDTITWRLENGWDIRKVLTQPIQIQRRVA